MPATRRDALKALGAAGVLSTVAASPALAGEHTGDDDDDGGDRPAADQAKVRVAHASPDAPNVDVYVDGNLVFGDLAYGLVTNYATLDPGTYRVKITAAGDESTVAFEGDVPVDASFYTVAAVGELSQDTFEPLVLQDGNLALARLVHASPDAPAVAVDASPVAAEDGEDDEKKHDDKEDLTLTVFDDVEFKEATRYVAVPPGEYSLAVRPAGDPHADPVATFEAEVEGGRAYTGYAIGYLNPDDAAADEPFDLLLTEDGEPTMCPEDDSDDADDDSDDSDDH
ncbi:DUF4397 domain-containing protein [Halostella sp. JP-L12]|uniref:DUF4397 domain-containing protein n=1 Tax=Halostella TaxID=1843185 RepID=UPI000EF7DD9B|nr:MULTISPECIES: DUF4397 domain-containing protein [Halostella]NHN46299.1 DUF4397 domain-containing protein [Halostella sp. JP-L12]